MKIPFLLFLAVGLFALPLSATDTLTVEQLRQLALQSSPLQQQKVLAETQAALRQRNLRSNHLPRVQLGAQASYQSDVFGFPVDNPVFPVPQVPKDQYRLSLDVSERLYDGGADRYLHRQLELERDRVAAQTDVDVFQLRELVTELFFKTLLLQENDAILAATQASLQARLRQAQAAVSGGVALRTQADQVQIQLLQIEQQRSALRADGESLRAILAIWTGRADADFVLRMPATVPAGLLAAGAAPSRPEYRLFDLQQQHLQLGQDMLRLQAQPRVELFVQAGLGRPNPFNFFETGFEPFGLVGLRAVWAPVDWGNRGRERQALAVQADMVNVRRQAFDRQLAASTAKDRADAEKAQALLAQDDAIIALQQDIVNRAEAQVQNGVMTTTEYLSQVQLLAQARISRKTHEIQYLQAAELLRAKLELGQ